MTQDPVQQDCWVALSVLAWMNRSGRSGNVLILSLLRLLTVSFPDLTPGIDLLAALTTAGWLRVGTWPKLNIRPEVLDLGQTED